MLLQQNENVVARCVSAGWMDGNGCGWFGYVVKLPAGKCFPGEFRQLHNEERIRPTFKPPSTDNDRNQNETFDAS